MLAINKRHVTNDAGRIHGSQHKADVCLSVCPPVSQRQQQQQQQLDNISGA